MDVRIEKVNPAKPEAAVLRLAARRILKGEVVVCPTDTGYAFAANALDSRAVARVFHLKGRVFSNPIHVAVNSLEEAEKYARVNEAARRLAARFLPGALTLVLPRREIVPAMLVAGRDTVGIRIPDNRVILRLAEMTSRPLTATSANISGQPAPYAVAELAMGDRLGEIALILDQGPLPARELSTIVDLTASPPQLIRQGLISWLEVRQTLKLLQNEDEVI